MHSQSDKIAVYGLRQWGMGFKALPVIITHYRFTTVYLTYIHCVPKKVTPKLKSL